jgi:hypothetical protein
MRVTQSIEGMWNPWWNYDILPRSEKKNRQNHPTSGKQGEKTKAKDGNAASTSRLTSSFLQSAH